jgi:hypothetical protein
MLEAMIQARTDPLEERYKPFFLEIVRSAQSSLNQRWEMRKGQSSSRKPQPSHPEGGIQPFTSVSSSPPVLTTYGPEKSSVVPPSYEVPPPLGGAAAMATFEAFEETQLFNTGPPLPTSDSGYGSQPSPGWCQCRSLVDLSFLNSQDGVMSSNGYVDPQDISSFPQQGYIEPAVSPVERTVVKCAFCGYWRFK